MSRRTLIVTLLLLSAVNLIAATLSGVVRDTSGEPLIEATVRLLRARDSSFVKGTTTNLDGRFSLDAAPGKYILQATYIGYSPANVNVTMTSAAKRLDPIVMQESSIVLKEAVVTGVMTEIKAKEDTIEYNAGSYRTQPNAVVEDLLKKLPGVEVGSDGAITANGKTITKILIDGKEFFSDDPKVASKNLPASMIDKLQVVDRKSDLARLTGVDDGEEETVINLTVKKGMNNGWFGTIGGGYGTDSRYQGAFNINRFWNGNQISFIGNANNTNDLGFSDGNGNRFRRFGGMNGINTNQSFGINFNVGKDEKFRVGGDVMYSHSDRDNRTRRDRQYLFPDSTSYYNSASASRDRGHNLRADFRVQWNIDSFNTLEFRPNISLNFNRSESIDSSATMAGDALRTLVNRSLNRGDTDGRSFEFGGNLIYNHKFRSHPGRSYSMQLRYNLSNVHEDENSYSFNRFYLLDDEKDLYDQYSDNHRWSNRVNARLTWTEPLGNVRHGRFLTAAYRISYQWNNSDKLVYDHPVEWPDGMTGDPVIDYGKEVFNETLSNKFRNEFFSQELQLGFKQVRPNYTLDVGAALTPSMQRSRDLVNSARNIDDRWVWNVAPYLRYRYKLGKNRSMRINYRGRTSQPTVIQLQPVADLSDPLNITVGNPDLKPTFTHNLRLHFSDFNVESQRSIMVFGNIQFSQNSIISKTSFNKETGGRTTTYTNVNGIWNGRVMNMISFPFRNRNWQFSNHAFINFSSGVGYNNEQYNRSNDLRFNESFSLAFRPANYEIEIRPYYGIQYTHNSLPSSGNPVVHTYGGVINGSVYTKFGLSLNTDLSYTGSSGYAAGFDNNQWMWNATISYEFLRNRTATVALKAYDLLQQRKNIQRTVTANYIDDTSYNTLTRYFMLTFTYKFNTFGAGSQPQDRNRDFMRRGPGGPPPRR